MEDNYPMIIAAFILLVFLIYKEIKRTNSRRLLLRLLAVFAAVTALLLFIFPVKYKTVKTVKTGQLHLLTTGTPIPSIQKDINYFTTDSALLQTKGARAVQYIPDLAYYLQAHPELSSLEVYGYGFKKEELKHLKNHLINFHTAPSPLGIISCTWPAVLKEGALLQVQGVYNNATGHQVKIVLEGLGTKLDSINIKAHSQSRFSLKAPPSQSGKALYKVTVLREKDTLQQEKIPFYSSPVPRVKLLVLSSFPDFEYKFLKNWLFENKYEVVFRTRISKDKFSTDQLNTTAINANQLQTGILAKFDGVIADDEELSKLDPSSLSSLKSAITNGLGLLIRMTDVNMAIDPKIASSLGKQFKLYTTADSAVKKFTPFLEGENTVLKPLPATQYLYIQPHAAARPLIKDQGGKVLISTILYGNGKINASILPATYPWILNSNPLDYASFWSHIISNTIRKQEQAGSWRTIPALPVPGAQTQLVYQNSKGTSVPNLSLNKIKLDLRQHTLIPYVFEGIFWPEHAGWNVLKEGGKEIDYLYIYDKTDWNTVKQQQTWIENIEYAENQHSATVSNKADTELTEKILSKWWFFALFLLSVAFLWFETKLL